MNKFLTNAAVIFTGFIISSVAFAQDGDGSSSAGLAAIGAGISMGVAAFGAATAQGRTVAAALEGLGRNPQAKDVMFMPMILGLVFMEFQALLGFLIAFMLKG
jgi:F-type H+-transporting ATPase subunit c